jgi:hypothetical protein
VAIDALAIEITMDRWILNPAFVSGRTGFCIIKNKKIIID